MKPVNQDLVDLKEHIEVASPHKLHYLFPLLASRPLAAVTSHNINVGDPKVTKHEVCLDVDLIRLLEAESKGDEVSHRRPYEVVILLFRAVI